MVAWWGRVPYRMRAWVGEVDGRVVGIGGVAYVGGVAVAFVEHDDDETAKTMPVAFHRAVKSVLRDVLASEPRGVYSEEGRSPTSKRWLRRLGFAPEGEGSYLACRR